MAASSYRPHGGFIGVADIPASARSTAPPYGAGTEARIASIACGSI
jgi:hypothetical protein